MKKLLTVLYTVLSLTAIILTHAKGFSESDYTIVFFGAFLAVSVLFALSYRKIENSDIGDVILCIVVIIVSATVMTVYGGTYALRKNMEFFNDKLFTSQAMAFSAMIYSSMFYSMSKLANKHADLKRALNTLSYIAAVAILILAVADFFFGFSKIKV